MRYLHIRRIALTLMLLIFCMSSYAQTDELSDNQPKTEKTKKKAHKKKFKNEDRPTVLKDMYLFGVARNYHDSITYFTNITPISKVVCDKETGFIDGLNLYTAQLENHLLKNGRFGYLCATFYAKNMKNAEKIYVKLKKKIDKKRFTRVEPLGDFVYQFVSPENIYRNVIKANGDEEDGN